MTMNTMTRSIVRAATAADVQQVRAVIAAANEGFRGTVPNAFFASYFASAVDVEGRLSDGEVLVAEVDERIVGSITFYRDANDEGTPARFPDWTAGVRATAVHPTARGLGVGRDLVEACIARALAVGATAIALHTASFMTAAVTLYERTGFRRAPEFDFPTSAFFPSDTGDYDLTAIAFIRSV